jgi:hypothetical protein
MSDITLADIGTRLAECEARIEAGLPTFIDVGNAIREIRDERLYRENFDTFEEYCRERWGWGRSYVNKQIEAANTVELVGTIVPISNEAQARELTPLAKANPDGAQELWGELVSEHGDKLTATKIKQAVASRMKREKELDRLAPEVAQIIKEIDPSDCDLPTSTKQLNYLAGVDDIEDQIEIATRVGGGEAVTVWQASNQLKAERGELTEAELYQMALHSGMKDEAERRRQEESFYVERIRKAGAMEYVVEWSDGSANKMQRSVLLKEHDYKKCKHCSGYGVVREDVLFATASPDAAKLVKGA